MRSRLRALLAVALTLVVAYPGGADEKDDLRAVIDKGIKARGGADNLAKFKAATWKGKGKYYGLGDGIEYTGEWAVFPPGRNRNRIEFSFNGAQIQRVSVVNGDKGWVKLNDMLEAMDKDALAEEKAQAYTTGVTSLIVLKDKAYELAPLGEMKVENRPAIGVRVVHKDRRDVNLYFDKENGILVKSETRVKDPQSGQEFGQEVFYGDYKEVDGIKHPMKIAIHRDGKKFIEAEWSDFKTHDKLDESVFAKP